LRLPYVKYKDLPETLDALADGRSDAVVNSVGALQYYVSTRYAKVLEMSHGLLAPAYMAFALPRHSELARPIDLALIKVTGGREWRKVEDRFFGK
jgi:ABC-type amino acid transport substrate-binding protein